MQALPSVDVKLRLRWIASLPLEYSIARAVEHEIHAHRQKKLAVADVNVYRYGTTDILDIDSPEAHEAAAASHYTEQMRRISWAIQAHKITSHEEVMKAIRASSDSLVEKTSYATWESAFLDRRERAREVLSGREVAKTGIFSCPKCKSFDVDTDQKQTRSADEPMTIFCTCNSCGSRFIR